MSLSKPTSRNGRSWGKKPKRRRKAIRPQAVASSLSPIPSQGNIFFFPKKGSSTGSPRKSANYAAPSQPLARQPAAGPGIAKGQRSPRNHKNHGPAKTWRARLWQLNKILKPLMVLAVLLGILIFSLLATSAIISFPFSWWRNHAQATQSAYRILDSRNRIVGVTRGVNFLEPGRTVSPVSIDDFPSYLERMIVIAEDKRFGMLPCWVLGIDWCAFGARALLLKSGGSTIPMQIVGNLIGFKETELKLKHAARTGFHPVDWVQWKAHILKRKVYELTLAPQLVLAFCGASWTSAQYRDCLLPLYATHIPFGIRPGGTIYGANEAAQAIWQSELSSLSTAQAAIVAALPKFNVWIVDKADDRASAAAERWQAIVNRARWIIRQTFIVTNDPVRIKAELELNRLESRPPFVRDRLFGVPIDSTASVSLHQRREQFVSSATTAARSEFGSLPGGDADITAIRLTVDAEDNANYHTRIERALEKISRKIGNRFCVDIARRKIIKPADFCPANSNEYHGNVVALVSDRNGKIKLLYGTDNRALDTPIPIGSVSKLVAVLLSAPTDSPETVWCDAIDCGATKTALTSIATSNSPATLKRMQRITPREIAAYAQQIGFHLTPGVPPATAIANGMVEATPRQLNSVISCIYGIATSDISPSAYPHVLDGARSITGQWQSVHPMMPSVCEAIAEKLATPQARYFARTVLEGVTQRGTLAFLNGKGLGKTGTPTSTVVPGQPAQGKVVVGAYPTTNGWNAYTLSITAPWATPLGQNLAAAHFRDFILAGSGSRHP